VTKRVGARCTADFATRVAGFVYDVAMAGLAIPLSNLILSQLSQGEMRVLSLTVAVRRILGPGDRIKGDLGAGVASTLRQLVAANAVVEVDGMYSLTARA